MSKPIAKSLHTVTVLVRVAALHLDRVGNDAPDIRAMLAVSRALVTLGLDNMPDDHGLIGQAIKQVTKLA